MKSAKAFFVIAVVTMMGCVWLASSAQAAIEIGAVQTFNTTPGTNEWATGALAGSGATYGNAAAIDAAVQTLSADMIASNIVTSATFPPSTFAAGFRRNTATNALASRPAGPAGVLLKATLSNSTPNTLTAVDITYVQD